MCYVTCFEVFKRIPQVLKMNADFQPTPHIAKGDPGQSDVHFVFKKDLLSDSEFIVSLVTQISHTILEFFLPMGLLEATMAMLLSDT